MKGITSNPALDAYQRMAISPVGAANPAQPVAPVTEAKTAAPQVAKVSISDQARQLAVGAANGPFDPEKVARLRDQLSEGLEFDSKQIAARMLAALG
jgi:anti-sigma28 factor (negative regulator of flagellin synthesis)